MVGWDNVRELQQLGHCGIVYCGSRKKTLSPTYRTWLVDNQMTYCATPIDIYKKGS